MSDAAGTPTENDPQSWQPDWVIELPDAPVVTLADADKDEFIHHLFDFMRQELDYGHSSQTRFLQSDGQPQRVDEWKLNTADGHELPRLWVISQPDIKGQNTSEPGALHLYVAGQSVDADADADIWRQGVAAALAHMGSRLAVDWVAIIAQALPSGLLNGQRLSETTTSAGIEFSILNGGIAEDMSVAMPEVGLMTSQFVHWPIQVRGSTACFTWMNDGDVITMQRLRTVTALLSLWWDRCWVLREGPRKSGVTFADARGKLMGNAWQPVSTDDIRSTAGAPIAVPGWLESAEGVLKTKRLLRDALLMHHEGLALRRDHPSMALVCFTAAIEAVAQVNKKPEKCPECGSTLSSRARFDEAVQSVLSAEQSSYLSDAYGTRGRSGTVHLSRLHGIEVQANSSGRMSLFVTDAPFHFTHGTVAVAQDASRSLLLRELGVD